MNDKKLSEALAEAEEKRKAEEARRAQALDIIQKELQRKAAARLRRETEEAEFQAQREAAEAKRIAENLQMERRNASQQQLRDCFERARSELL